MSGGLISLVGMPVMWMCILVVFLLLLWLRVGRLVTPSCLCYPLAETAKSSELESFRRRLGLRPHSRCDRQDDSHVGASVRLDGGIPADVAALGLASGLLYVASRCRKGATPQGVVFRHDPSPFKVFNSLCPRDLRLRSLSISRPTPASAHDGARSSRSSGTRVQQRSLQRAPRRIRRFPEAHRIVRPPMFGMPI